MFNDLNYGCYVHNHSVAFDKKAPSSISSSSDGNSIISRGKSKSVNSPSDNSADTSSSIVLGGIGSATDISESFNNADTCFFVLGNISGNAIGTGDSLVGDEEMHCLLWGLEGTVVGLRVVEVFEGKVPVIFTAGVILLEAFLSGNNK